MAYNSDFAITRDTKGGIWGSDLLITDLINFQHEEEVRISLTTHGSIILLFVCFAQNMPYRELII